MHFKNLIDSLNKNEYAILPNWIPPDEVSRLGVEFSQLKDGGRFKPAGISKSQQKANDVRRDEIYWFEPGELLPGQSALWEKFEVLRQELNRELYLGLWDLEGHFAHYPEGGFYRRHLDRFAKDDARTVTVVLYFNENWCPENGGELVIFPSNSCREVERHIVIEPRAGTLVVFLSAKVEHEVLESHSARQSFTGWYRRRR